MPAHAIVAEPSTLTGSIGVVLTKFVIDGTLKKLGMNMEGVSQGKYANMYSPIRPFSPEERVRMVENMQATYDTFVEKAAQGRNTTPERIDAIAQGRASTVASLLGFGNPKIVQALAAPLQVFRRGEPLALMPNVFVR